MPTLPAVTVGTSEVQAADGDPTRTLLVFSNPDSSAILYVSDEPGHGTDGIPIYPQNTVALSLVEGWNTRARHYAISDTAAKSLKVSTGHIWETPQAKPGGGGDGLPHPVDPAM